MVNRTFIYVLLDNKNNVRYVGKSDNPSKRLKKHINESKKNKTYKEKWIQSLLNNNLIPELLVIDEVPIGEWSFWEIYWISQFKMWGVDLVNGTSGGEGSDGFKGKRHNEETINKCRISGGKTNISLIGEKNGRCKLKDYQIAEIKEKNLLGVSRKEISKEYNITKKYIYYLITGKRRKHI